MTKAKKQQKPRTTATGKWLYCNFSARPEEIAKWKAFAQADRRSLSSWIRDALNKAAALIDEERMHRAGGHYENPQEKKSTVGVETVSPDRA
jgi:hypothetical protein